MTVNAEPERAWITAAEAARELNVARATLYAYVSRGLVTSRAQAGTRKRLYAAGDIARLRSAREPDARSADARAALAFGMPVLDSAITQIVDGRFYYRGRDALSLAEVASVETVAGLLWGDGEAAVPIRFPDIGPRPTPQRRCPVPSRPWPSPSARIPPPMPEPRRRSTRSRAGSWRSWSGPGAGRPCVPKPRSISPWRTPGRSRRRGIRSGGH